MNSKFFCIFVQAGGPQEPQPVQMTKVNSVKAKTNGSEAKIKGKSEKEEIKPNGSG